MNIKITGASGYLGKIITRELVKNGHQVAAIDRGLLYGPAERLGEELQNTDTVINLAGAPVLQRWNKKNKKIIYDSRVLTAQNMVKAIKNFTPKQRPPKVISASAIHIYAPNRTHSETSYDLGTGFLSEVVKDWERAWKRLPQAVTPTIFRLAVVLGRESETIQKMLFPFKLGIGGKIGSGRQPFPFVHEQDVARAFVWAVENPGNSGIYNLAAPQQITNATFTQALAKNLGRPAFIPVPAFALKIAFGEAAGMLTKVPAVQPDALMAAGFEFNYATIESALKDIFQ